MSSLSPFDEARRRLIIQQLSISALTALPMARTAWAAGPLGGRPEKLPPGQSVYRVTGKVLVNGQQASADTRINANATIETALGGELVFVVGDSAMLVRQDTRIALQGNANVQTVRLTQGKVLSVYGGGTRSLTTPTAAIGITGTGVYMEADPEQTYFCTCYGTSDVRSVANPAARETVTTKHHDRPLYIVRSGQAASAIRPAPFINHTDQELMLIETLVGRTPPFILPGSQYNAPRPRTGYR